jgi:hypothetical protein
MKNKKVWIDCEIADDLCVSDHSEPAAIDVNDNTDDGSWRIRICRPCAAVLGIKRGGDMPENSKRLLQNARPV